MKRRDFFRKATVGAVAASIIPAVASGKSKKDELSSRSSDKWQKMGSANSELPKRKKTLQYDVAVSGGGLAGICAAIAAARNGANVVLIQDRPVLGGNSSSEMRVHVHGVSHLRPDRKPERETGILEEILLHNRFNNPQESWPVWDHILYDFVEREEGLELLLNTQAVQAIMDGNTIKAARCWQATTETEIIIEAKQFIDCSGDGLLAATSGALYRTGREASDEFGEKYAPKVADGWQMGNTILLSSKDMGKPMPFEAPSFTLEYEAEKSNKQRKIMPFAEGFWWVEVGSDKDIVGEAEEIRKKLMGYAYGVWDHVKNSGKYPQAENYALDWVGSLPGRRESRRFIGDFIMSETDLTGHRHYDDAVAYGGWSLDEHCWAGIENLQDPPSYFHEHFKEVYEIPYRILFSKNITNLQFAGRNVSQTHISLSSSRVMGTCSLMGQAVGTAAALCIKNKVNPRDISKKYVNDLQEQLMRDDAFIPLRAAKDTLDIAKKASQIFASSTTSGDAALLTDGTSRDFKGKVHHWESDGLPAKVQLEWEKPVDISQIMVKCDTNIKRNIMMLKGSLNDEIHTNTIPEELLKSLNFEARVKGKWIKIGSITGNRTRLIKFDTKLSNITAIRVNLTETYGAKNAKLFEVRCYS